MFAPRIVEFGLHMAGRDYNQCLAEAYPEAGKTPELDQDRIVGERCLLYSDFSCNQGSSYPGMVSENNLDAVNVFPGIPCTVDIIVRASWRKGEY